MDLLCNSPVFSAAFTKALGRVGIEAELASPLFYHEPELLASCPRPSWLVDLVVHLSPPRPIRLAVRAVEGAINFVRLIAAIRSGRYDVVHVQWTPFEGRRSPFMPLLRRTCDRARTLLVYTAHNATPHDNVAQPSSNVQPDLNAPHLIVTHTRHVADEIQQAQPTTPPIVVIPFGPFLADEEVPAQAEASARLDHPSSPVVLFQGGIRPYKGVDLLYEAWPLVVSTFPTASLVVVGKVAGTEARRHVEQLRRLESVRIVDRYVAVRELLDYYSIADIVVLPYRRISQSAALMTAVGLGRPVVVTPIDGFREQIATLRSAVVADEVSGPAIARALVAAIERRHDLAALAAEDRLSLEESPVGWPSVASTTRRAYESALDLMLTVR